MSHMWIGHDTHVNVACHTRSHIPRLAPWFEWVMSHTWMSHSIPLNVAFHTYRWRMANTWNMACTTNFEYEMTKASERMLPWSRRSEPWQCKKRERERVVLPVRLDTNTALSTVIMLDRRRPRKKERKQLMWIYRISIIEFNLQLWPDTNSLTLIMARRGNGGKLQKGNKHFVVPNPRP